MQHIVLSPLAEVELQRGDHDIALSVGALPSGAYMVRVKAILTKGIILTEQRPLIIAR